MLVQEDREARQRRREEMAAALLWAAGLPWVIDLREPSALLDLGEPLILAPAEREGWVVMMRTERLHWAASAADAARWIVRRCCDSAARALKEVSAAHEQLAQLLDEEVSAEANVEASAIRRAPEGAQTGAASPATLPVEVAPMSASEPLTPEEEQLAEEIRPVEQLVEEAPEPAPNSPADVGGYGPPDEPKTGKRARQAQLDRYHQLIEPVERDARELLYERIRARHGGRTYDQLLPLELIAICDYLERIPMSQRSAQIRLRAALKKLDLPDGRERHLDTCEACGQPILWVWTEAAKAALALDAYPSEGGIYTLQESLDKKGRVLATCWGTAAVGGRHSHSKTCTAKAGRVT